MPGRLPKPIRAAKAPRKVRAPRSRALVVAVGASAGGLDAFRTLLKALPDAQGMAIILVQHLDPNHESLLVDLLAGATSIPVQEAAQGMPIEAGHIYVIPRGVFLTLKGGGFELSAPRSPSGPRLPFDVLLRSVAVEYGDRAVCVILSGTGADGSLGLQAIKDSGGLVIAQDTKEAAYDGMPQSAVATGLVDTTLVLADIPPALIRRRDYAGPSNERASVAREIHDPFAEIIDLVRSTTAQDFGSYKPGTLNRRIERRMAIAALRPADVGGYLKHLKGNASEVRDLANDLLIHVTGFFRDKNVFDFLQTKVVPELVAARPNGEPLRVWIAGCSTGEEAYSLAIVFLEAITAAKSGVKLQIFASDVDAAAVAVAREGFYSSALARDISEARLAAFFTKEPEGYRVSPNLRASVIFTTHDLLVDPPFSRLDMVSCRNVLIYLSLEAQAKVISLFHFALNAGGVLLLGKAETAGSAKGLFEPLAKTERIYRQTGHGRPGDFGRLFSARHKTPSAGPANQRTGSSRQSALAELCRQQLLANFTPAAAMVTGTHECIYLAGPAERYLRVPLGHPTQDILAMVPAGLRAKLRAAIRTAAEQGGVVVVDGGRVESGDQTLRFKMEVRPVRNGGETLFMVCFVDQAISLSNGSTAAAPGDLSRVAELEQELAATKVELRGAILDLELTGEEQKAVNEDALSVNEEFQSTNEELLTSKEELQSLNEELTALNSQLQETLERQRTTADDLQNVLYSTDLATLFLDRDLKIRFFTPATKLLFNILPGDVGRPLADLKSLANDTALTLDAKVVLKGLVPIEKEIESEDGEWFVRRILPYRAHDDGVEGVVVTFTDITERKHVAKALEAAKQDADQANRAKSRFLAVASHDLRQPLQALSLLQGLLAKVVDNDRAKGLVRRLDETLSAMSGMLNTLLDINQIESGTLRFEKVVFPVNDILERLKAEFSYQAKAQGLELIKVRCSLWVESDPRLLEQMLRNMLANALKYTKRGKVLLGCRRRRGCVRIEIWDSGVGIAESQLGAIFDEYHQVDNVARERSRGLGLGLSIVKRLGDLLEHPIAVQSRLGMGSVFSIEADRPKSRPTRRVDGTTPFNNTSPSAGRKAAILVVDDDPDILELLQEALEAEGHAVVAAVDGLEALSLLEGGLIRPDIVLADFNLPAGMNGLELAMKARGTLHREIAVAILTGDISAGTLRDIARDNCVHLSKPVRLSELNRMIQGFLAAASMEVAPIPTTNGDGSVVYLVDDDDAIRHAICGVLEDAELDCQAFSSAEAFLHAFQPGREACLLVDAFLPGIGGVDLLHQLKAAGHNLPTVMITGHSDVAIAVQAMKAGACEFIEKPITRLALLGAVNRALDQARDANSSSAWRTDAAASISTLTIRQHEIMDLVLAGHPSKNIAADLGISQRTVENHRASIMKKTGAKSLPALARLALAAA
jgi:two-component system CheB/CheR fusion protein